MNGKVIKVLSAAGVAAWAIAAQATSTFIGSDDGGGVSSLKADKWANWHGETAGSFPNAGQDYIIRLNKTVRVPREAAPFTFTGRSLHVGSNDQGEDGHLGFCAVATTIASVTEFANNGLYFERGYVCQFNNWTSTMKGKLFVRTNGGKFGVWCWNDIKAGADDYSSAIVFDCPVDGSIASCVQFALNGSYTAPVSGTSTDAVRTFRLKGDLSAYLGVLEVLEYLDWEETGAKSKSAERQVRLVVDGATCGGTVRLMRRGILEPALTDHDFTVSRLELRADSALAAVTDGRGRSSCVKVANQLAIAGPVRIIAGRGVDFHSDGVEFIAPVLKAPAGETLDVRDFTVHDCRDGIPVDVPVRLYVETDPADGLSTLYAKKQPRLYQSDHDAAGKTGSFAPDGALGNNWPDGQFPSIDKNYTSFKTIRTPTGASTFAGASLTLAYNGTLVGRGSAMRIDDLRIIGNAYLSNYGGGDGARGMNPFAPGGTMTCEGRIRMMPQAADDALHIDTAVGRYDVIASEISGRGTILVNGAVENNANGKYVGWVELAGMNTNFAGKVKVTCATFANVAYGIDMPSMTQNERLVIRDARNLGGPLPDFAFDALTLEACSQLWPRADVTLDDATRGIYVNGTGRFLVSNDVTLAVAERITYNGELVKEGGGLLRLGGEPRFGADSGAAPTAGLNRLTVAEGALEAMDAAPLDGLATVLKGGTTVQVDVSNAALRERGAVAVASGSSLSVEGGTVAVRVIDRSGSTKISEFVNGFVPFCTVSAADAAALEGKFVVDPTSAWRRYGFSGIGRRQNADGTVTFGVIALRLGLGIIVH